MKLPTRPSAALVLIAATTLWLVLRPRPTEPEPPPEVDATEQLSEIVHLRIHAKGRIAREVADGRRSLWDAAALFRELDRMPPAANRQLDPIPFRQPTSIRTEDDQYCWSVIVWVWNSRRPNDVVGEERAKAAIARLTAVFEDELCRGAVRLPDPSALESVEALMTHARAECGKSLQLP